MKRTWTLVLVAVLGSMLAWGQSGSFTQLELGAGAPPEVKNFGGSFVGSSGGSTTIYYWIVAKYPVGDSIMIGPLPVGNTPARQNLGVGNTVELNWSPMPSATGYDVIWSETGNMPGFPCASCGVLLGTTALAYSDNGSNNLAYSGPNAAGEAHAVINLDNLTQDPPWLKAVIKGVTRRIALVDPLATGVATVSGTPVAGNCAEWVSGTGLQDSGGVCGGGVASVFGRVGIVVAAGGDYTGSQVTNVPAGGIAAVTAQLALNELDTDKVAGSALTANLPVFGNGTNNVVVGTRSGTTTEVVTVTGAKTLADCTEWDANGNLISSGAACGGGAVVLPAGEVGYGDGAGIVSSPTFLWNTVVDGLQAGNDNTGARLLGGGPYLGLYKTASTDTATTNGFVVEHLQTLGADSAVNAFFRGTDITTQLAGAGNMLGAGGVFASQRIMTYKSGTGNVAGSLIGISPTVYSEGGDITERAVAGNFFTGTDSGTVANVTGVQAGTGHYASAALLSITNSRNFYSFPVDLTGDGFAAAITNHYGFYNDGAATLALLATLQNHYGFYTAEVTGGTNNWNVYSAGAGGRNFFEGGMTAGGFLFAGLGTPDDGTTRYCTDCQQVNPCAGGGAGALARREAGAWNCGAAADTTNPVRATFALCLGIDCAVAPNLTNVWISDAAYTISKCYAYAKTAPVGSVLTFDVNKNGATTIFSAAFSIADGANAANTVAIAAAGTLAESDFLTVDIDAVGGGTAGSNVTVTCVMD